MSNPNQAAIDKAFAYIKELHAATDFKPHSESKGVKISMKEIEGSTLPITRGDITFPAKYDVESILKVVRSVDARKVWDGRFEDAKVIEEYGPTSGLLHSFQKGQWPIVSGRDFVVTFAVIKEGEVTYLIQTSVEDSRVPTTKDRVRATLHGAGWILTPTASGDIEVVYIAHADPSGTLPAALVRMVSADTPACAGTVLDYLNKKGVPK
ncbi:hypothetical protein HDU76_001265 [Blyttiomyces sp. JEL0837]|nr:hypothetical protein HDU76_001265 [Blyttiomyces sp. JEL0837]